MLQWFVSFFFVFRYFFIYIRNEETIRKNQFIFEILDN